MAIVRSFFISASLLITAPLSIGAISSNDIHALVDEYMQQYATQMQQQYDDNVEISYEISALDRRLALADCLDSTPTVDIKSNTSLKRLNVQVRCDGRKAWSLYVPVELQLYRQVVTTAAPITRDTAISAEQLQLSRKNIARLSGSYYSDVSEVVGFEARRNLTANTVITSTQLAAPVVIKKGETVLVIASTSGLSVKLPATALSDGRMGEQISVRNSQSKRTVDGKVIGPGKVQVLM
jgi:flagella basal body P-ring formation protein FlgA